MDFEWCPIKKTRQQDRFVVAESKDFNIDDEIRAVGTGDPEAIPLRGNGIIRPHPVEDRDVYAGTAIETVIVRSPDQGIVPAAASKNIFRERSS